MDEAPIYDLALAARFRGAFGYKGMKPAAIASALGVSTRTVHRLETGQSEIDLAMQRKVIEITGVPEWFLEYGFAPPVQTGEEDLRRRVEALEQALRTPRVERVLEAPGGQLGHEFQAETPSRQDRPRTDSPGGPGANSGNAE